MFNRNSSRSTARWTSFAYAVAACALALFALLACAGCSGGAAEKESLDKYGWDELSAIAAEIHDAASDEEGVEIAESYNLLDSSGKITSSSKSVTLSDGTVAHVMLAGIRADDLADGGKAGLTFVFTDAPAAHAMNAEASNEGGWEKSEMRSWLNGEFAGMLPSDLKGAIKSASKKTDNSAYTTPGSVSSTSDKLWLLSLTEVIGSVAPNDLVGGSGIPAETYNMEGKQYQLFKEKGVSAGEANSVLERSFVGKDGNGIVEPGEACPWWMRSLGMTWTSGFAACDADGDPFGAWITDHDIGVAPGFCL